MSVSRQPSPEARGGVHGGVGGVNGTDVTTKGTRDSLVCASLKLIVFPCIGVCYKCNASFAKLLKRKVL